MCADDHRCDAWLFGVGIWFEESASSQHQQHAGHAARHAAGDGTRAGQTGQPSATSRPYFGSTPPEAYFRPDPDGYVRFSSSRRRSARTPRP